MLNHYMYWYWVSTGCCTTYAPPASATEEDVKKLCGLESSVQPVRRLRLCPHPPSRRSASVTPPLRRYLSRAHVLSCFAPPRARQTCVEDRIYGSVRLGPRLGRVFLRQPSPALLSPYL